MTRSPRRLKHVQDTVGGQVRDLPLHAVRLAMFGVGRALLLSDRVTKDYKEIRKGNVLPVLGQLRGDAQQTAGKAVTLIRTRGRGDEAPEQFPPSASRTATDEPEIAVGRPAPEPKAEPAPKPAAAPSPKPAQAEAVTKAKPEPKPEPEPEPKAEPKPAPKAKAQPAPEPAAAPSPKPKPQPKAKPEPAGEPAAKIQARAAAEAQPKPTAPPIPESAAQAKPAAPVTPKPKADAQPEAVPKSADLPVPGYDNATLPQLRARLRGLSADQIKVLREYERKHAARAEVLRMFENRLSKLNGA
jgi:hypothetical protein